MHSKQSSPDTKLPDKTPILSGSFNIPCAHQQTLHIQQPEPVGILNITPDSFSDGGELFHSKTGVNSSALHQKLSQWAPYCRIIDIGGESTRPGAQAVSADEECARILPAIEWIRQYFPALLISVDTRKAMVAQKAIQAGAHIINDVSGGQYDNNMFKTVSETEAAYILMHSQGLPASMQEAPQYDDILQDLQAFFTAQLHSLRILGIPSNRIILDPGFGFGKSTQHNLTLLKHLKQLQTIQGEHHPMLVGLSRKSFLTLQSTFKEAQDIPNEQRDRLTAIAHAKAYQQGALLYRTHCPIQTHNELALIQSLV